jgi:hypothetical protein
LGLVRIPPGTVGAGSASSKADQDVRTLDDGSLVERVIERDERAWRELVRRFDQPLRDVVAHATTATHQLESDEIDDVLGEFWLWLVEDNRKRLRTFDRSRGTSVLTWLTFLVSHVAHEHVFRKRQEPATERLDAVREVMDPRPLPEPPLRHERRAFTMDEMIADAVSRAVRPIVRQEIAAADRARQEADADRPRPAAWWAAQLGCSAESLVKRAKRGSLEYVRIGARYHFTRAQIEGSDRWQRRGGGDR